MNHELEGGAGAVRRHGQPGARVDVPINAETFEVVEGSDTIDPGVRYWNYVTRRYWATASPGGRNPAAAR